jgi:GTPase KRas protein
MSSSSVKLIVMGSGGVGKSAMTCRFTQGRWVEKYDPTIEDSYSTTVDVEGKALQVDILDTAGQEEYSPLRETFMHTGDGFVLVYSLTDDATFEDLQEIRTQITEIHPKKEQIPFVVVANKLDLAEEERAVSLEEGQTYADSIDAPFIEISAKENLGVRDAFELIIKKILEASPEAGQGEGEGGVMGAGVLSGDDDNENEEGKEGEEKKSGEEKKGGETKTSGSGSGSGESKTTTNAAPKKKFCFLL